MAAPGAGAVIARQPPGAGRFLRTRPDDDADLAARYQRQLNDAIAREVSASGGRLAGLGGVPLQDPDRAVAELERAE